MQKEKRKSLVMQQKGLPQKDPSRVEAWMMCLPTFFEGEEEEEEEKEKRKYPWFLEEAR